MAWNNAVIPVYHELEGISVCFDARALIPYTGHNRVGRTADCATVYVVETGKLVPGHAADCYHKKESGVGNNQDDPYAARRASLDRQFSTLPPAGSDAYWQRIEEQDTAKRLPLEVLARCCRERIAAGALANAHRIFTVIGERIRVRVGRWAEGVAAQAKSGMKSQLREDLEQECYMKLWEELAGDSRTFLLESFAHKLDRICDHVAHSIMEQAGEWKRRGVEHTTRIPPEKKKSMHTPPMDDDPPLAEQIADTTAQDEFDLAEYSDLLEEVAKLPREARKLIHGLFYDGRTQEEIAAELGVTDRTIRNRLKAILQDLRQRYQNGQEDNNV